MTTEELKQKYENAISRQKRAKRQIAILRTKISDSDRRSRAQRLIALGAIVESASEADDVLRETVRDAIQNATVRDTDAVLLKAAGWLS